MDADKVCPLLWKALNAGPLTATVAVKVGSVSVFDPATAGACRVIEPDVSPLITTAAIFFPYKTTHLLPDGTVTLTPFASVIGPVDIAEYPDGIL